MLTVSLKSAQTFFFKTFFRPVTANRGTYSLIFWKAKKNEENLKTNYVFIVKIENNFAHFRDRKNVFKKLLF